MFVLLVKYYLCVHLKKCLICVTGYISPVEIKTAVEVKRN